MFDVDQICATEAISKSSTLKLAHYGAPGSSAVFLSVIIKMYEHTEFET